MLNQSISRENVHWNLVTDNIDLVYYVVNRLAKYYPMISSDIEEFVQIGTIGLINAANKFDENRGIKFSTYACVSIRNEVLKEFKKNSDVVSSCISIDSTEIEIDLDERTPNLLPLEKICKKENLENLKKAFSSLRPSYKQVVKMRVFEKKSFREIAEKLKVSGETARMRYNKALSLLATEMGS